MNPRFAPFRAYFPAGTAVNSNLPSSEVTTEANFCGSLASLAVMRARARGWPSSLLTTVPAILLLPLEVAGWGIAGVCAPVNAGAPNKQRALTWQSDRIETEWVIMFARYGSLDAGNELQLHAGFLSRRQMDDLTLGFIRTHGLWVAVGKVRLLIRESQHAVRARRYLCRV